MKYTHTSQTAGASTKLAISDMDNNELLTLLQNACEGSPVLTPKGGAVILSYLVEQLKKNTKEPATQDYSPEWGTMGQVAKIYGMSPEAMDNYLLPWAAAGKLEVITPTDPITGKPGRRRFNLAQVAELMSA